MNGGEWPGDDPPARPVLVGEKDREICRPAARARSPPAAAIRCAACVRSLLCACVERGGDSGPLRRGRCGPSTISFSTASRSSAASMPSARRNCAVARSMLPAASSHRDQLVARINGLAHHSAEGRVGSGGDRALQGAAERARRLRGRPQQHREGGAFEHLGLEAVVEHRKARRHIGLERKLLQQPGAEGMDGLHLEAARRLQCGGEKPPRAGRALAGVDGGRCRSRAWPRRARRRRARSSRAACRRRRAAILAAAALVKVMQRIAMDRPRRRRRRAAAGSPAAPAHGSCRSPHWRRRRPSTTDRRRRACGAAPRRESGAAAHRSPSVRRRRRSDHSLTRARSS